MFESSSSTKSDVIIEAHGLTRTYRQGKLEVHALRGIDMTLQRGEFAVLAGSSRTVVVDAGATAAGGRWWAHHGRSLLVLRPCYLGLRRAGRTAAGCDVVVIDEPGRALTVADVRTATGANLRCCLPWDPAVARAVDAGILTSRMPRSLRALGVAE